MQASVQTVVREYIVSTWLNGDSRGFDDDTDLKGIGMLDSFSTLALVAFLDESFNVQLDPAEINAESFKNVHAIANLLVEKLDVKDACAVSR